MTDHNTETDDRTPNRKLAEIMITCLHIQLKAHAVLMASEPTDIRTAASALWLIGCLDATTCIAAAGVGGIKAGEDRFNEMQAELADKIDMFLQLEEQ